MKNNRRSYLCLLLICAAVLVILVSGCGAEKSEPEQTPEPSPAEPPAPTEITVSSPEGNEIVFPVSAASIELPDASYIQSFIAVYSSFTGLKSISFPDGAVFTRDDIEAVKGAIPGLEVIYHVSICGSEIAPETRCIELAEPAGENGVDIPVLIRELSKLPELDTLKLNPEEENPELEEELAAQSKTGLAGRGPLSFEEIALVQESLPGLNVEYDFWLYGQKVSLSDERLEYEKVQIGDEGLENFRLIMPCMKNLTYLKLDTCETSSECMGALREEFPDIKIAWRIWFSHYGECGDGKWAIYNTLTDTEKIWATGCVYDEDTEDLKYCTDVKYLDLGHNAGLHKVDFIRYMPKLEVAVLSITYIDDISPLAGCSELEFLELFRTYVSDLSPLENCTKLAHLYVYDEHRKGITDISPVMGLDSLKRFYCTVADEAVPQTEEFKAAHPDCETDFTWVFIGYTNWRTDWRTGGYAERYLLLREQIGYDTFDMSK